jgi:hypothetical protein
MVINAKSIIFVVLEIFTKYAFCPQDQIYSKIVLKQLMSREKTSLLRYCGCSKKHTAIQETGILLQNGYNAPFVRFPGDKYAAKSTLGR